MRPEITLRGPDDVVAALPYQLGYHPSESVVLVAIEGGCVALVARCDLPPPGAEPRAAAALVAPVLRERFDAVVLVGYEEAEQAGEPLLLVLVEQLERAGVQVLDVAVVRGGRRFSPLCDDEGCCPGAGVPLADPADVPAVAELVALGRAPLATRGDVPGLVEPDPAVAGRVAGLLGRRVGPPRRDTAVRAWSRVLDPAAGELHLPPSWPPRVVADAAEALADIPVRDALVGWLAPGVLPREVLDAGVVERFEGALPRWGGMGAWSRPDEEGEGARTRLLQRLLWLCRALPDSHPGAAAATCTVTAHVAWSDGDGAVARAAVDRALRLDPGYRLAVLLARLVDHGVRMSPRRPGAGGFGSLGRAG
jgi:hypothetical protein